MRNPVISLRITQRDKKLLNSLTSDLRLSQSDVIRMALINLSTAEADPAFLATIRDNKLIRDSYELDSS